NAFGRQVRSFEADLDVGLGEPVRGIFIRAPWIDDAGPDVEVLAEVDGHPVLARHGRILVAAFHPELTDDTRIHELFLNQVREATSVDSAELDNGAEAPASPAPGVGTSVDSAKLDEGAEAPASPAPGAGTGVRA